MTFNVRKVTKQDTRDRAISITYTSGPVTINLKEHVGHLRAFHADLGDALDEIERVWPTQSPPPNAEDA